ncbi:hypothetical protein EOJ36_10200 [Sandaracinomonas limnophila]|uniref:C-type lysozyme inhibitor domain-containing protein n=1 Tax=Sandaracinomonas limnophila TaxID=1862386 RepID=A0A437PMZ1_9BACT|nr:hypothetical protein [Sandaracinomonas limnophila]RVU23444.1 hypothetical protein EOJ36_10200 [Sandaracinomonas limnophila]
MTTILIIIISILGLSHNQIGGQKDSNGCLTGAGFQWSNLEKSCIRAFELKIQLTNSKKSFNAGVLFNSNKSKAEVFSKEGSYILTKYKTDNYSGKLAGKPITLHKKNGKWIVSNSQNKILYSQP